MLCNDQFDIPVVSSGFTGQFVCLNSGIWNPNIEVPDCVGKDRLKQLLSFIFQLREYHCNNTRVLCVHTHTHTPTPPPHTHTRIALEQKLIYHGYIWNMNAFPAGKRHVL